MSRDERFHVFIILPLFPAGSLQDLATRYVLRWIYKTINLVVWSNVIVVITISLSNARTGNEHPAGAAQGVPSH